jgi:hypothetical protein
MSSSTSSRSESPVSGVSPFASSKNSSSTSLSSLATSPKHEKHDVHQLPEFTAESLANPSEPILYLPPLISSLPTTHLEHAVPLVPQGPLATEVRLPEIDEASLALHKTLHKFKPITAEYAHESYAEAFNWDELELPADIEKEWYLVAFRSFRKPGSDSARE